MHALVCRDVSYQNCAVLLVSAPLPSLWLCLFLPRIYINFAESSFPLSSSASSSSSALTSNHHVWREALFQNFCFYALLEYAVFQCLCHHCHHGHNYLASPQMLAYFIFDFSYFTVQPASPWCDLFSISQVMELPCALSLVVKALSIFDKELSMLVAFFFSFSSYWCHVLYLTVNTDIRLVQ